MRIKLNTLYWVLALFSVSVSAAKATSANEIYGEWVPPDMDAVISVQDCENLLCAKLVHHEYSHLTKRDVKNPDVSLRDRALIGLGILNNFRQAGEKKWRGGSLYDPRTGKKYIARIEMLDLDRMKITACIKKFLCKGYVWTRAKASSENSIH